MRTVALSVLLWLLALPSFAADTILPATGKLVGVVISDEPGDWGVLAADLTPVEPKFLDGSKDAGWRVCIFEGAAGRYAVIKVPKGGGLKISTVVLGGVGPTLPPPVVVDPNRPPPDQPPPVTPLDKVTAVTYVYEKDQTHLDGPVLTGINRLNREKKVLATLFEQPDDLSKVPANMKVVLAEAQKIGLPSLVATGEGGRVLRFVKDPRTEEQVLGIAP